MFLRDLLSRVLNEANDAKGLDFGHYVDMVGDIAKAERDLAEAHWLMHDSSDDDLSDDMIEDTFESDGVDASESDTDVSEDAISDDESVDEDVSADEDSSDDETFVVDVDVDAEPLLPNGDLDSSIMEGVVETSSFSIDTVSETDYSESPMPFGIGENRALADFLE